MQVSITLTGDQKLLNRVTAFLDSEGALNGVKLKAKKAVADDDDDDDEDVKPAAKAKPASKKAVVEDEADDDDDDEDVKPAAKASKKAKKSDDDDDDDDDDKKVDSKAVIAAFQAYSKENGRPAAAKVLKKLGYASVRDIPEKEFGKAIKAVAL